ncbi:hypothetical protein SCA6_014330 [Theobroma cacao]
MVEGSGEYSPIVGSSACQTRSENGHIRVISSKACSCDRMKDYAENSPNLELASASDKVVDMGENDEASDEDAISFTVAPIKKGRKDYGDKVKASYE